jgi:hypothetical protein
MQDVDKQGAGVVALKGQYYELLEATIIEDNTAVTGTVQTHLDKFVLATILLTISAKTFDASTTMDIYLQYSPDKGTTWDDIAAFTQITDSAVADGTYVLFLNALGGSSQADRATRAASLSANSVLDIPWCDRMRVKCVGANISGTDTITAKVEAYMQ